MTSVQTKTIPLYNKHNNNEFSESPDILCLSISCFHDLIRSFWLHRTVPQSMKGDHYVISRQSHTSMCN